MVLKKKKKSTESIFRDEKWLFYQSVLETMDGKFIGKGLFRLGLINKNNGKLSFAHETLLKMYSKEEIEKFYEIGCSSKFIETFKAHDQYLTN